MKNMVGKVILLISLILGILTNVVAVVLLIIFAFSSEFNSVIATFNPFRFNVVIVLGTVFMLFLIFTAVITLIRLIKGKACKIIFLYSLILAALLICLGVLVYVFFALPTNIFLSFNGFFITYCVDIGLFITGSLLNYKVG